jgi:hypothetical protein
MSNLAQQYEVAVIDEIQVLKESPIIISVWRGVWSSWLNLLEGGGGGGNVVVAGRGFKPKWGGYKNE